MDKQNEGALLPKAKHEEVAIYPQMVPVPREPVLMSSNHPRLIEQTDPVSPPSEPLVTSPLSTVSYPSAMVPGGSNVTSGNWDPMIQVQFYQTCLSALIFENNTRHRAIIACTECRKRKVRCQTSMFSLHGKCQRCWERKKDCIFTPPGDYCPRFLSPPVPLPTLSQLPVAGNPPFITESFLPQCAPTPPGLGLILPRGTK
ncbi:uncharacterized protein BKA55DRAFT_681619 [Fusarium redolens]|uniref:Zn(2)-C6 fungal-type domain-containing protein n=1 Tax=Fusarium redolens TaxID=48865 RepID=A0A9P9FXL3_FUSRE|nr:uncharacterized protein BKA55DRAFT_681619 [Fusarium redolens]KAH7208468.1 hypothetical protein BKA55DRAFT_681619 [Fusarium redolens]